MDDNESTRHTVTSTDTFDDELLEYYPSATSVANAIVLAASQGVAFRKLAETDPEEWVREIVRDELEDETD